jgi:hypothetical protein
MLNLLYKEVRLVIHPLYYLIALFGVLLLIPNWVYFVALMYFLFIAFPNIFVNAKAQNDIGFSVLLPVKKSDVVKARILSMTGMEVLQILVAGIFVALNISLYPNGNFLLDANLAYLGCVFLMYGVFNVVFYPLFYKTADKIGMPILVTLTFTFLYATLIEVLSLMLPQVNYLLDGNTPTALVRQIPVFVVGILLFTLLTWLAYYWSAKNFEKVDL